MRLNRFLLKSTLIGALGGLLFGFDTAVIAGTTEQLRNIFHLTPGMLGVTVSVALWGTVAGAILAGPVGQKLGGRETLRITAILYVISALGCACAWRWPALIGFRFIGGIGIGGSSVLGPVYIAELAPARLRGRLVGLFQINIVVGILLAYASNYLVAVFSPGAAQWRYQLGVAAVPAALFLAMLFVIPRSSRWLVTQNRIEEAREVLQLMGSPDSDSELRSIVESIYVEQSQHSQPLFRRKYLRPMFLAVSIGMFNQLSGINAILYYLNDIFAAAGFGSLTGNKLAVLIGAMNLAGTIAALAVIDRLGRRTLLLTGAVGMAVSLGAIATMFFRGRGQHALPWLFICFILFFAVSQGSVIWVYLSEVFPTQVRSKGQSLGSSAHWITNALVSLWFPGMAAVSMAVPFAFFGAMMVLQLLVVAFFYPETRGVSLEQLQQRLELT